MAVRTSWVDTDVGARKDLSSTTSGISVLVRKQTAQNLNSRCIRMFIGTTPGKGKNEQN